MARYYDDLGNTIDCDVRKARKFGLFPSVTTILKTLNKEFLNEWKIKNAVLSALTLQKNDGETLDSFAERVLQDAEQQSKDAMSIGSEVHDLLDTGNKEGKSQKAITIYNSVINEIKNKFPEVIEKESVVISPEGYAGRFDALVKSASGEYYLIDYKTQSTKEGKKSNAYDEYFMQLEAYKEVIRKTKNIQDIKSCIIVVSTTEEGRVDFHECKDELKYKNMFFLILRYFHISKGLNYGNDKS